MDEFLQQFAIRTSLVGDVVVNLAAALAGIVEYLSDHGYSAPYGSGHRTPERPIDPRPR